MVAKALLFTALCIQVIYGYPAAPFAAAPCAASFLDAAPIVAANFAAAPFAAAYAYDVTPFGYGNGFYGDGPFGYGFGYDGFAGPVGYRSYGLGYPAII